jgi:hypothetical protein
MICRKKEGVSNAIRSKEEPMCQTAPDQWIVLFALCAFHLCGHEVSVSSKYISAESGIFVLPANAAKRFKWNLGEGVAVSSQFRV